MISKLLHSNKKISNLVWAVRGLFGQTLDSVKENYFKKRTTHIIDKYMSGDGIKKLNIGAQGNDPKGWLNTDLWAGCDGVAFLDATKTFPFKNESFDYIFSEHMIEHISYESADFMVKECWRVLKKGGKIRIATPSLENFKGFNPDDMLVKEYFEKQVKHLYKIPVPCDNDYLINYIFYNFHHRFIYGKSSMTHLLKSNNFTALAFYKPGVSDDAQLTNIEQHGRCLGMEHNMLETMVVEATKP